MNSGSSLLETSPVIKIYSMAVILVSFNILVMKHMSLVGQRLFCYVHCL